MTNKQHTVDRYREYSLFEKYTFVSVLSVRIQNKGIYSHWDDYYLPHSCFWQQVSEIMHNCKYFQGWPNCENINEKKKHFKRCIWASYYKIDGKWLNLKAISLGTLEVAK